MDAFGGMALFMSDSRILGEPFLDHGFKRVKFRRPGGRLRERFGKVLLVYLLAHRFPIHLKLVGNGGDAPALREQ